MDKIIEIIKKEISDHGYSYYEIERMSGITAREISYIINKKRDPKYETVKQILESLGYELEIKK